MSNSPTYIYIYIYINQKLSKLYQNYKFTFLQTLFKESLHLIINLYSEQNPKGLRERTLKL